MEFHPNKTPIKIIEEEAFGGSYFRDIIQMLMENGTEIHGKNSMN